MSTPHGKDTSAAPGQDSDLARLIALEQRLSAQQEAARVHDEQVLATARTAAAEELAALARELALLRAQLSQESQVTTTARIQALEAEGAAACARYDALDDAQVTRLAGELVQWLLAGGEAAP